MKVPAVDDSKLIDDTVAATIEGLNLAAILSDTDFRAVQIIGAFIMNGMQLDECCILAQMNPQRFALMMESEPNIRTYIVFKQVAYKASLMRVLTHQAIKSMDQKIAGWILERKYREEYSMKNTEVQDDTRKMNALEAGIEYIRENGDSTPIVSVRVIKPIESSPEDHTRAVAATLA